MSGRGEKTTPASSAEIWKWIHSEYGDELGLTSEDESDDHAPYRSSFTPPPPATSNSASVARKRSAAGGGTDKSGGDSSDRSRGNNNSLAAAVASCHIQDVGLKNEIDRLTQENNRLKSENDALRAKLARCDALWEHMDSLLSMMAEDVEEGREKTAKQE